MHRHVSLLKAKKVAVHVMIHGTAVLFDVVEILFCNYGVPRSSCFCTNSSEDTSFLFLKAGYKGFFATLILAVHLQLLKYLSSSKGADTCTFV